MAEVGLLERERLTRKWAGKMLTKLDEVLPNRPVEADFRRVMEPLLDKFCEEADINPLVHAEYTLATGRADTIFNRLVIEWKRPGVIKKGIHGTGLRTSIKKVRGYVQGLAKKEHRHVHRLAAVIFDGHYHVFIRFVNNRWSEEAPIKVNRHSLERFLTWLTGLSSGIALTAETLSVDFSIEQPRTRRILTALFKGLGEVLAAQDTLASKLFEQWRSFFSESVDYTEAFGGRKLKELKAWVHKTGLEVNTSEDVERFLFALHTYFALLVKFLAWLALSRHLAVKLGAPSFGELVSADSETLNKKLQEMESGGIFRAYGLVNLLEGDFFSWYLYAWNPQIEDALRELLKRLEEYDPTTLAVVPEETRDLFKKLYHYLLPRKIRHNLGEYYTPDWLAQRLLNQIDNEFFTADPRRSERKLRKKILTTRWLDPACGSGTFPILIIERMRALGDAVLVDERELLDSILENVVGIDLNPLAVLTARVNYLLSITDLLEYSKRRIRLPVYLADTVRTPAIGREVFASGAYEFPTSVGRFLVPAPLCTKDRFDIFCEMLESKVRNEVPADSFVNNVEDRLELESPEWNRDHASVLTTLYRFFLQLHRSGMDGLWARVLRNNSAPITEGQFDYIVGNPPWVNWENLPDRYRTTIKPLWEHYGLFPHRGMDTILGKGKKDISMLMTYTVCDTLLKDGGRLGFVITQPIFKTVGAGQGFRRFSIPQSGSRDVPLSVVHVDDMTDLNPFEGASNRTAVVILEKGRKTEYPVPYTVWRKRKASSFMYGSTLDEVADTTRRLYFKAQPVEDTELTSSWLTARPAALRAFGKLLGKSHYKAHEGVNTGGANGVYWIDIIEHRPDGLIVVQNKVECGRVEVAQVTEGIEAHLVYPLLRGRDVQRWKPRSSAFILMVQDPSTRRGIDESELQQDHPCTYGYLKRFEDVLRRRAAFKRYFTRGHKASATVETGPFYSMFDVGEYTVGPSKVVWREQATSMTAAVIGSSDGRPILPDHKLMLVACDGQKEAHYVCAVLNSNIVRSTVLAYAIEIQMGPHILKNIRIPKFDRNDSVHKSLADLSVNAHKAAREEDLKRLEEIESEIDHQAARLWDLTEKELVAIERNLKDLISR